MFTRLFLLAPALLSASALAQLDSSSAVLLRPSGKSVAPESLDSTRYKVRLPESKTGGDDELDEKPGAVIPSPVPTPRRAVKREETASPAPPPGAAAPAAAGAASSAEPSAPSEDPPPVGDQVKQLLLGGNSEEIEEYQKQVSPNDPRTNVLSVSFAPAYFYQASQSDYSFRRYTSSGPGFGAGMNLWFTPFFGLQSTYFSSVTAGVRSGPDAVPLDVQVLDIGIRFRRPFGLSRRSPSLVWGLDYHDAGAKISRDSTANVGRRSSGLSLALAAEIPSSTHYTRTLEVAIQPRLHHSEPATGVSVRSGSKNETNAIHFAVGGVWALDRRNQLFWRGQYDIERTLFQGAAGAPDARTGDTPNGVSVTDSLMMFYFGFKWGS